MKQGPQLKQHPCSQEDPKAKASRLSGGGERTRQTAGKGFEDTWREPGDLGRHSPSQNLLKE